MFITEEYIRQSEAVHPQSVMAWCDVAWVDYVVIRKVPDYTRHNDLIHPQTLYREMFLND